MMSKMNIIEQFKQIRLDKNYSYGKLNMMTGLPKTTIKDIVNQRCNTPRKETSDKIELFVLRQKSQPTI